MVMNEEIKEVSLHNKTYKIIKLLGHGKGGYSYLAESDGVQVVVKLIHHEPCSYYSFGNKIEAENNDYKRLKEAGITIPEMIDIDLEQEIIIKEYIPGKTIFEMVKDNDDITLFLSQVREMAKLARVANLNIDYFPTNFIPYRNNLYYVDYECNSYMEEWNFENWGIKYWSKTKEFIEYINKLN